MQVYEAFKAEEKIATVPEHFIYEGRECRILDRSRHACICRLGKISEIGGYLVRAIYVFNGNERFGETLRFSDSQHAKAMKAYKDFVNRIG